MKDIRSLPRRGAPRILVAGIIGLVGITLAMPEVARGQGITIAGEMTYTQNFNSIGTGSVPWTNNSTVAGWYAAINDGFTPQGNLQPSNGTTDPNGLLNLGTTGAIDRALGSKATGTNNFANIAYGVLFHNTTADRMRVANISYAGELWRVNSGSVAETWSTFYKTSATPIFDLESGASSATPETGTYFALPALNWFSPNNSPASGALDGNQSFNRTIVSSASTDIIVEPDSYFMLRWVDTNLANTDGHQGIDDVTVIFRRYRTLVYNLSHTVGGAPNGSLVVGGNYWVDNGVPAALAASDDVNFTQTGNATINVPANITLGNVTVDASFSTYTIGGPGRISGKLLKYSEGTLVLTSPNSFSSAQLFGGTVETRASGALGNINVNLTSFATWKSAGVAQTHSGNLNVETGGGTIQTDTDLTITGGLMGFSSLNKTGPGVLTFNGTGTASSGILISEGTLRVNSFTSIGTNTQNIYLVGGTLELPTTGTVNYNDPVTATRNLYVDFPGGSISAPNTTLGNAVAITKPDSIIGSGTLGKSGAGTLRISTTQTQFSGNWEISGGFLELQTVATGLGPGTVTVNSTGTLAVQNLSLSNPVDLNGGSLGTRTGDSTIYAGIVQVLADSFVALRSSISPTAANSISINGTLTGSGGLTLVGATTLSAGNTKALILRNTGNTYSGTFTVTSQQNLVSQPTSGTGKALGTAKVNLRGGTLQIRDNGTGSNGTLAYGNDILTGLPTDLAQPGLSTISVDRVSANTGNTVALGSLTMGDHTLAFTGANNYRVSFSGGTFNGNGTLQTNGTTVPLLAGNYGGPGGFTKAGTGALVFAGTSSFAGAAVVSAGTLTLTGSLASASMIDVKGGATLDVLGVTGVFAVPAAQVLVGAGTVQGNVRVDGTLAPGPTEMTLSFANSLTLGGTAEFELRKFAVVNKSDLAVVAGTLTLGGTLDISVTGDMLAEGDTFNLFDAPNFSGQFSQINLPFIGPGMGWDTSKLAVDGTLTVIPEPGAAAMLIGGLGLLLGARRRRS